MQQFIAGAKKRGCARGNASFLGAAPAAAYAHEMSHVARDIPALVGNTPLLRLHGPSAATGCEILGKCEFLNPGGSVKDRAALSIIEQAEADGTLRPGGTIVEGTAGNTGIGLALIGNAKGYRTVIVIPETQAREKKDTLRALGAELVEVAPTSYSNPAHYVHTSRRIAEETPNALWSNQFDNIANRLAHIRGTAPEIWTQTERPSRRQSPHLRTRPTPSRWHPHSDSKVARLFQDLELSWYCPTPVKG